jgi:hypothetical protein
MPQTSPTGTAAKNLSATSAEKESTTPSESQNGQTLIATLELHVHADLDDEEVVKLTRWAWERSVRALGGRGGGDRNGDGNVVEGGVDGEDGTVEVTVGVVRG